MENNTIDNLRSLIVELKRSTVGFSKEKAFERLIDLITSSEIKYVYNSDVDSENISELTASEVTDNVTSELTASEVTSEVTSELTTSVTSKKSTEKFQNVSRILLTTKRNRKHDNQLSRECNGVVLQFPSWDPLVIPSPILDLNCNLSKTNFANYNIYKINDGTTITLYYYNNKWCIASTNGVDISSLKWIGPTTYMNAFLAAAANYPGFKLNNLDKSLCYTVGFRFKDHHPLCDPSHPHVWFISAYKLDTLERITNLDNLQIPHHTVIQLPTNLTNNREIANFLSETNEVAILNKIKSRDHNSSQSSLQLPTHYGYILRSIDNMAPSYVIESSLMKQIRNLFYNQPKPKFTHIKIDHSNRLEYAILRSYLNVDARCDFKNLFPELTQEYYTKYDNVFNKLTTKILNTLRNTKGARDAYKSDKMGILFQTLVNHIEKNTKINPLDSQSYGIVQDFIMNPSYLDLFFAAIV